MAAFRGDKKLARLSYIKGVELSKTIFLSFYKKRSLIGRVYSF